MMKHTVFYNIVLVVVVVVVSSLTSCRPDTVCRENTHVALVSEFRRLYLDEGRQLQIDPTWDSLTVVGLGATQPLYNNSKNLVQIALPMHIAGDSTMYTLCYRNQTDTICVRHTNSPYFISMECGCAVNHTLQSIRSTKHWIDSISIVDPSMTTAGTCNIVFWKMDYPR